MRTPEHLAQAIVSTLFGQNACDHIATPAIADLQHELAQTRSRHALVMRVTAYTSMAFALFLYGFRTNGAARSFALVGLAGVLATMIFDASLTLAQCGICEIDGTLW